METTIDSVIIDINTSADNASAGLKNLINTLNSLNGKLKPVVSNLTSLRNNLNNAGNSINKLNTKAKNTQGLDSLSTKLSKLTNVTLLVSGLRALSRVLGSAIDQSNQYIENLNLFYVSMGKNAERAKEFTDNFSEVLGVDPSNVMRYMGIFNTLAEGFGLSSEKAYVMSKNLTQLSYDMSSFLNIPIEQAMQKIKSGFSGEIEPMRAVGVALDQATLQETAYTLGLKQKVSEMTRAQKSQLLYYQMITKTTTMQGDMARTLLQPANAIRVLKQQFTQLARAIGNIFIPILTAVIPYVMVLTKWLTTLAQSIANFFGFELPTIDTSNLGNVSGGIGDIEDSAKGATKELKKMLAPFDELNVIDFGNDSGSGSGAGGVGGELDIPLPEYDALTGALSQNLEGIEAKLKEILPIVGAVGASIATWKIGSTVLTFLSKLGVVQNLAGALKILAGVSLIITGVTLFIGSYKKLLDGDFSAETILKGLAGAALVGVGAALIFSNPVGLIVGLALGLMVVERAVSNWRDDIARQAAAEMGIDYDGKNLFEKIKFLWQISLEAVGITEQTTEVTKQLNENMRTNLGNIWSTIQNFFAPMAEWIDTNVITPVKNVLSPIVQWFDETIIQPVSKFFTDLWADIGEPLEGLWAEITGTFQEAWEVIQLVWEKVQPYFQKVWQGIQETFITAWEIIKGVWNTVQPYFQWVWEGIKAIFGLVTTVLGGFFSTAWEAIKAVWNNVVNYFSIIWSGIKAVFAVVKGILSGDFTDAWEAIKNVWNKVVNFFEGVKSGIQNVFGSIGDWFHDKFAGAWQRVKDVFSSGGQVFEGIKDGIANVLKTVINAIIRGINKVISIPFNALNNILRKLKNLEILGVRPFNWIYTFSVPQIPQFEDGGFPTKGQMFIANEAGPELIGNIGRKSAVANNDQIIEGIRQGVAAGVSEAMPSQQKGPINVYIGNKKVYSGYGEYANTENNMYGSNVIKV